MEGGGGRPLAPEDSSIGGEFGSLLAVCRRRVGSRCYFLSNFLLQDAETLLRSRSLPLHLLRLQSRTDGAAEITPLTQSLKKSITFTFTFMEKIAVGKM